MTYDTGKLSIDKISKGNSYMNSRQRMLDAIEFNNPDKIPVVYHPSPAGLYTHGERLLDLFNQYPPDNIVAFDTIPAPPPGTIAGNGSYRETQKDEWGTEWDFRIFGIQGHPKQYPFGSWEEAADYSFPSISSLMPEDPGNLRNEYLVISGWISLFEKLNALRPMDEVLMDFAMENQALLHFLDRLVDYWMDAIQILLDRDTDVIMFGDDWGTQSAPFFSPEFFNRVFKPHYSKLMAPIRKAGKKIFFHCCGFLGYVLDDLIDLGICGLWPQISLFDSNPSYLEACRKNGLAIYIHPDRQYLVPKGSPLEIETAVKRYAERYRGIRGGGIFYVEIENDAPFINVKTLIESIDRYR